MAEVIIVPKLGFNMDEGQLVKWHRRVGETVRKGEVLFEINIDRTTIPVEATADGTVLQLMLEEGVFAEMSTPIAVIGAPGEDPNAVLNGPVTLQAVPAAPVEPAECDYDAVVIGTGPGGYETAIKVVQCGKKTCITEGAGFGGTCLSVGYIPTEALIQAADVYHKVKDAARFAVTSVEVDRIVMDTAALQVREKAVVKTLINDIKGLLRGNKVTVVEGMASFVNIHTLSADGRSITGANIVIAIGSNVFMPPSIALEGENHLLIDTEALDLDQMPASVAVIGGGVIGMEFACLLSRLGSKVTVLELMGHILSVVDTETPRLAEKWTTKDGILFRLGAKISRVKDDTVYYESGGQNCQVKSDMVLMAVGRVPSTQGSNTEGIGIEFDRKAIRTDAHMCTNISRIHAIGDVNGKVVLAYTASHEGMVAAVDIRG